MGVRNCSQSSNTYRTYYYTVAQQTPGYCPSSLYVRLHGYGSPYKRSCLPRALRSATMTGTQRRHHHYPLGLLWLGMRLVRRRRLLIKTQSSAKRSFLYLIQKPTDRGLAKTIKCCRLYSDALNCPVALKIKEKVCLCFEF